MTFECLEKRMAQSYIDMLPPYIPDDNAPVSTGEQKWFYDLISNLFKLAFDEPLLFVSKLHEDDVYPSRYKKPYGKPNLILNMKKFINTVDALIQNMFLLGQSENVILSKRQLIILSKLGIDDIGNLPSVWLWMSKRESANLQAFSYCLFDKDYPYTSDIYAKLLGKTAFKVLENRMIENGYKRYNITNVIASDCKLSLTIANPKWDSIPPRGGFEYKIRHTGISAQYEFFTAKPAVFGLCIPNGMKVYLQAFDSMDNKLQRFVVDRTKKCDVCKYCVQTDKSGTRPLAYIPITYENNQYRLCTYFPGYNYSWNNIDDDLANELIDMLSFMDQFAPES